MNINLSSYRFNSLSCTTLTALILGSSMLYAPSASAQAAETDAATASDAIPGEIVVTAQRRSERLTDVPVSVTALSGTAIANSGVTDTYSLQQVTPGLRMERLGVYTQPSIRGVTAASTSPGAEANVAMYVDGIYQPNQAANTIDLPDIERVEVLKGPQGTLFGRNATGGAIQIFTKDPTYKSAGNFGVSYGRFHNLAVKGFVSAPLIEDRLAMSVSGYYEDNDGWIRDLLNNGKRTGQVQSRLIRGKLLYEPADGVKFVLSGQYSHRKDNSLFLYSALNGNTQGANADLTINPEGPVAILASRPWTTAVDFPSGLDVKSWNVALKSSFELGTAGTLSTVSAYQKSTIKVSADGDASSNDITSFTIVQPDKNFTQEVNFASEKFGDFSFVAGLFYYKDDSGYDPLIGSFGGYPFTNFSDITVRAWAAYAEGKYEISDKLTAIAGVRYSKEKRTVQYVGGMAALYMGSDVHEKSWDSFTPRVSLRYEVAPRTNVYATYSQGFKSGVYDLNSTAVTPVNPEKIKAYEVGFKTSNSLFDLNLAGFLYNYSNLQVQYNKGGFDALQNAGAARNYGIDVEGNLRVTSDLTLTSGFTYLHARYRNYNPASILVPLTNGSGVPVGGNRVIETADLSGYQVSRAPNWTLNLAANYLHEFDFGTVGVSGNMYHTDDVPMEQSGRIQQKAYTQFNARVSFEPGNSGFKFSLWGKNLSNEKVFQSTFITTGTDGVSYAPPRTYGVSLDFAF